MIETPRLRMQALLSGPADAIPVVFVLGNASSATYWEEIMLKLPARYRGIAPDLCGYGDTEDKLIDATRGYSDWVDDLLGLAQTLGLDRYHVVGHSLGGSLLFGLLPAAGGSILSTTLVNPGSPYAYQRFAVTRFAASRSHVGIRTAICLLHSGCCSSDGADAATPGER